jgi:hypothetical protein
MWGKTGRSAFTIHTLAEMIFLVQARSEKRDIQKLVFTVKKG